jgi:succinoglycan biosynthesis protein ExoU
VGSVRRIGFAEFVKGNVAECSALDLGFLKPLIRRSFLNDHGLKFRDDMRLGEDFELYARALARGGRFILTSAKGYVSVETKGSLSKEHSESDLHRLREASHALRAIRPLSSAEARALRQHYDSVDKRLQWRRLITAVREHNVIDGVSTLTSGPVMAHLLARLGEQAWLRSRRLLPGPPPRSMFLEL